MFVFLLVNFPKTGGFKGPEGYSIVIWNGDYFIYEDGKYNRIEHDHLKSKISEFFIAREFKFRKEKKKLSVVQQEMNQLLLGLAMIPKELEPPFLMPSWPHQKDSQVKRNWLNFENGVLDLDDFLKGKECPLLKHTQAFFSVNKLPYRYDPNIKCPTWLKFLASTFDDHEVIDLIQEWFGYNLINHTDHQLFFLAVGQGSNGKSVMLKVLSLMLGEGNFASVGLESFDPKRSYALAHLSNVMANIVNDLNEMDKTGEGLLKQFVAGEPITVERKYKDHFTMIPRAKITLATNVLPKFMDRSDGIWRRMVMVEFKKQILDKSKQDKRLMSDEWWKNSEELPGVLNWALQGLKRLEERTYFNIPLSVKESINKYRMDSNAAATFLKTHFVEDTSCEVCTHTAYLMYSNFCSTNGYRSLNAHNFAAEVKRMFPNVSASKDPKYYECVGKTVVKTRAWHGLRLLSVDERPLTPFI